MHDRSCLCGAVQVAVTVDLPQAIACHCAGCRKQTGQHGAFVELPRFVLSVSGEEHVRWHRSSEKVRRGFCAACGSTLFWDPLHHDWTAVAMGVFDDATGTRLSMHIFVAEKSDYCTIKDGLPQIQR